MGVVYVKGDVVAVDPPDHLAYTIFGPNSKIADIPANYLAMTYDLKECGQNGSALEITQGHFAIVEDGQARYQHSLDGDDSVLKAIKKMAEEQAKSK